MANHTAVATRKSARNRRTDQPGDQLPGRQWRHQIIDDRPLDLADQQGEGRVGEAVLEHCHDDQARRQEVGEWMAEHHSACTSHRDRENDEIQHGGDRRPPHGLQLHLEEPAHLLDIEGLEPSPVNAVQRGFARLGPDPRLLQRCGGLVVHYGIAYRLPARAAIIWSELNTCRGLKNASSA
jgi:hypothetical protein